MVLPALHQLQNLKINKKIIKIDNAISLLNNFGKLKRDQSLAKIIAVTGSAGKTSFKKLN